MTPQAKWMATGGGLILVAVTGVALALQATGGAACAGGRATQPRTADLAVGAAIPAAPPVGSAIHRGKASFYTLTSGGGNCSYTGPPADRLYVALSPDEYADAAACGGYLDVTGPRGTVRVKIVDKCPECPAGHIDLSREAFARLADPVRGIVPVTYRAAVNPKLPGPLAFRVKDGASQWWFAVLVVDHGNPLRSVEVRPAGGSWQRVARTGFNYWVNDGGLGPGPYAIRLTDVYGRRATAGAIRLAPEETQRTKVLMYGRVEPRAPAPKPTRSPSGSPSKANRTPVPPIASANGPTSSPAVVVTAAAGCS
jgi:expansin (peptidoglycan-binding protein)